MRNGSLDKNSLAVALLQYRDTQDRDVGFFPAQILFARKLRDVLPFRIFDYVPGKE